MNLTCIEKKIWTMYEIDDTGETLMEIATKHNKVYESLVHFFEYACSQKGGPLNMSKHLVHEFDKNNNLFQFIKSNGIRVIFFLDSDKLIICTHCILKSTKKAKSADQKKAIRLKEQYFEAKADGSINYGPY